MLQSRLTDALAGGGVEEQVEVGHSLPVYLRHVAEVQVSPLREESLVRYDGRLSVGGCARFGVPLAPCHQRVVEIGIGLAQSVERKALRVISAA